MGDNETGKETGKNEKTKVPVNRIDSSISIATQVNNDTSGDSSSSNGRSKGYKGRRNKSRSRSKSLSSNGSAAPRRGGGDNHSRTSSHLSSVGYGSGTGKPGSREWSRNSNSDEYRQKSNPDVTYYNSNSNFTDDKLMASKYHTCITAALDTLKEDIMYGKHLNGDGPQRLKTISEVVSTGGGEGNIGNQQLVYMEDRSGGFVPITRTAALNGTRSVWLEQISDLEPQTCLDLAIIIQRIFAPISRISFGLLGGVALMQSFMSYTYLRNSNSIDDMFIFIESYNIFAKVAPTAFYILLAICIVAIFDRFDLAHLDVRRCSETLFYRHGWILLILYIITLLLTLSTAELDDMLLLYPHDKTFTEDQQNMFYRLSQWHTLNVFRCIFAMLGWFIMAIAQPDDMLLHHLKSIKQFDGQPKDTVVVGSPATIRLGYD